MASISGYIFRQLALAALFVAGALTLLISLFGSVRLIDFIVNRGLPISVLFEMSALNLPKFMAVVLPIAIFAAVLVVYNKLTNDSELVAMRAAGIGQMSLARPGLLLGALGVLISYALHLYLVPAATHAFKLQQFNYRNSYGSILLQEQRFNAPVDGLTIYVRERSGEGELRGIFAHDSRVPERPVTYTAERGIASQNAQGTRVVLFNGSQQEVDRESGRLTLFNFDQYSLDLSLISQDISTRWREPEERFLSTLLWPGDGLHDRTYSGQLIAEGHRRLTSPLQILAFAAVAVAVLLSGDLNRRGQTNRILLAITLIFAIQVAALGLSNISRRFLAIIPFSYGLPISAILLSIYWLVRNPRQRNPAISSSNA
ncbi:MAG: LPS export ABC transporter permease LptF [Alphaproteobacteria bacterium]|nr:LPS export ABC transporter permease LptF [Alphaproteobacteria bacterium]HCP00313.1 LPS export ABC transporter permease LptF [Rhodospirillaceae bacterium]